MKTTLVIPVALCFLPLWLVAQVPSVITMAQEPHHHLVLQNGLVNVYDAQAAPGDSLQLHRHDHDAIAIAIGDQITTVGVPGKPDVHSKNADGQVRMQRSGYVHSTHVDGDTNYFTVAVELLRTQTGAHNLCAAVLADQPLNCPADAASASSVSRPQFETDQTHIEVLRVRPHQTVSFGNLSSPQLIVTLDSASITAVSGGGPDQMLRPGDFVWFDKGGASRVLENKNDKEVRVVTIALKP
jgi:hypothetical protein